MHSPISALALAAAIPALALSAAAASALDLVALSDRNELIWFADSNLAQTRTIKVSGVATRLIGIDVRPADGKLYGVATDGHIYVIAPSTGEATMVSKISTAFDGAKGAVVDFNPVADRLRVVTAAGDNLRINVETGAATVDGRIMFAKDDPNGARTAMPRAGAYTNAMMGAKATQLYQIDAGTGAFTLQDPPNDGVLRTKGPTGLRGTNVAGFDIATDAQGTNWAFAVNGTDLYRVDITTGKATKAGKIGKSAMKLIDIAVLPAMM
jgi:outer membrane protein assembly factor BamB